MNKKFLMAGAAFACIAVVLGAFSAHALRPLLSDDHAHSFHTAVEYQFYHSLALLIVGILSVNISNRFVRMAGYFFIAGIFFFSGSLYVLSTIEVSGLSNINWLGPITPLGGLCFILGWIMMMIGVIRK